MDDKEIGTQLIFAMAENTTENASNVLPDIMRYESAIWAVADDLRGVSIKEFYVPEKLDSVEDVLAEIKKLEAELREVEL